MGKSGEFKSLLSLFVLATVGCSLNTDLAVFSTATVTTETANQATNLLSLNASQIMIVESNIANFNVYGSCDPAGGSVDLSGVEFSSFSIACPSSGSWTAAIDFSNATATRATITATQIDEHSNVAAVSQTVPIEKDCLLNLNVTIQAQQASMGRGSSSNPIAICSSTQLDDLAGLLPTSPLLANHYELRNYIDLFGHAIAVIPGPFTGTFDGNGLTIKNYLLNNASGASGFFGDISGASAIVKNLVLENAVIRNTSTSISNVGLVTSILSSSAVIEDVHVSGSIETEGGSYLAGIASQTGPGTKILNSTANVTLVSTNSASPLGLHIGGIAGANGGEIKGCRSEGQIEGTGSVGGIAGSSLNLGSTSYTIKDSSSSARVTGNNQIGGVIGSNIGGIAENLSSSGTVSSAVAGASIGGIIGQHQDTDVERLHFSGTIAAIANQVGGLIGTFRDNRVSATADLNISKSSFTGELNNSSAGQDTGGIVGAHFRTTSFDIVFHQVSVTGDIAGGPNVGGIIGDGDDIIINDSYVAHTNISGTLRVGGFAGRVLNALLTRTFSSPGSVTGSSSVSMTIANGSTVGAATYFNSSVLPNGAGGVALTDAQMRAVSQAQPPVHINYTAFDFSTIWKTDLTKSVYPILSWQ